MREPLNPDEAKRLIGEALGRGSISFSRHACDEMKQDKLDMVDCVNVLRAGVVEAPELEKGTWRYRVRTGTIVVVVAFADEMTVRVVTAWRIRR